MLAQLLALRRPLIVPDVETTSTDPNSARIVEIGFQLWDQDGLKKEWSSLVNPGIPIPPEAGRVHGITAEAWQECRLCRQHAGLHPSETCSTFRSWPRFKDLAANLALGFSNCDYAGKRVRFDLQVIEAEMQRAGVSWTYRGARIIDADRLEQIGEPRTLAALYEKHLGQKMENAHRALADVQATTAVIVAQLEKYANLPRDLDKLHALQWPGEIDTSGRFKFVEGVPTCMFGKHRGRPMREIPIDYYDWLLSANFPDDVKKLAADAKLGKFPEVP